MRTSTPLERQEALDRLLQHVKHAWSVSCVVPGMENFGKRHRGRILVGGLWFWLIVGVFYLMWYYLVLMYVITIIAIRISWALILTLGWGVAVGLNSAQVRLDRRKALKSQ